MDVVVVMTLEPTEEQLREVDAILDAPLVMARSKADKLWAYVRDQVLEVVEEELSAFQSRINVAALGGPPERRAFEECHANGVANCVAMLHAMKGKP